MYLKSIELTGFKSFAKRSELEFTSPISTIVGPNGSGKSNVAEAFRFVLGEQSIKSMRGKRGEDLIWNGAGSEPRANRAAVKVVFDNSSKLFNIDFSDVVIERVVHRDGTNEYSINGSKVRLKDVLELLAAAKIGASGHHIISQGEADKVLSASPKERKAFVEDSLGLRIYEYKRVESERKLEKTFENIAQVESLRREIAPHLKFLKKQVEKYEKAESMRTDLETLAKQYFKAEEEYLNNGRQRTKNERQAIEAGLAKLAGELAEAKKTLEKVASEKNKGQQVLELESEIARTRAKKSGFERELGRVEGLIDATDRTIKKERELAASEEHKMIRLKDVEELLDEVSSLTLVEKIVERIKEFIKERRSEASSTRIIEAEARIEELSKEKQDAEHALNKLNEEESELRKKYEDLKKEIEQDKDSGRDAEKAVFGIMSEENELRSKLSLVRAEEEKLNLEEAEFRRELEEVGHLVGPEVLKYREASESSNSHASPSLRGLPRDSNVEDSSALQAERREQEERKREIQKLKIRLEDAGLSGADEVLKEHKETSERDEFLARELLDLLKSAESLKELVKDLQERLATEFSSGIEKINKEFGELFQLMFGGGEAELVLVKEVGRSGGIRSELGNLDLGSDLEETEEEIEEGLDIKVNLPRKKIRSLMMLSGGERALTSIALIFALSAVNPPPFIILDETDAALDEANSRKYGDMVERLAKRSQLILITHNRETMSRAGVIYGVTMSSSGASKLLSIAFDDAVQVAK